MATKIELVNQALYQIRAATWAPPKWVYAISHGYREQPYNYLNTHNFAAQLLLWEATHTPGVDPPPADFVSPALKEAYIQMKAAYWHPHRWAEEVRVGHKGAPYQYALSRNWKAQVCLWEARTAHPVPTPPPPHPDPVIPADPRMQYVACGAFAPWDALQWPRCRIWLSADPAESISKWVSRLRADDARSVDHDIGVWYVPDQVPLDRARQVAGTLGTDVIVADCETLYRWKLAYHSGIMRGIANLSALFEDAEAHAAISSGEFHVINEFYWNQSKQRQPDNHYLPVDSMLIATYDGCSDSTAGDCWHPHVQQYQDAGYFWPTVGAYQQGMTADDWARMPVRP